MLQTYLPILQQSKAYRHQLEHYTSTPYIPRSIKPATAPLSSIETRTHQRRRHDSSTLLPVLRERRRVWICLWKLKHIPSRGLLLSTTFEIHQPAIGQTRARRYAKKESSSRGVINADNFDQISSSGASRLSLASSKRLPLD